MSCYVALYPTSKCTKIVSLNPAHGDVIMFVSDLRQASGFLQVHWFPPQYI